MPRIPKYEQNALPSAMVGTPGVDTSVSQGLTQAGAGLNRLGQALYDPIENDYIVNQRALLKQQQAQQQAEKELQKLYDQTKTSGDAAQGDIALNDLNNELRNTYRDDVTGAREEWDKRSDELVKKLQDGYTDPTQRLMFEQKIQEKRNAQTKNFSDYVVSRMPDIAKSNANRLGDALQLSTNSATFSGTQILGKIEAFGADPNTTEAYRVAYGKDAEVEIRKRQSNGIQNFLAQVANTGDEKRLETLIKDTRFDKYIEGRDKEQFYTRQRSLAAAVRSQQKVALEIDETQTRSNIVTTVLRTDPDDIESLKATGSQLRETLQIELGKPASVRSRETVSKLQSEIEQNDRQIRDLPKRQRAEARQAEQDRRDAQLQVYRSDAAQKVRLQLTAERAGLTERLKTIKNPSEALKLIQGYSAKVEKYGNGGSHYLDVPGSTSNEEGERAWTNRQLEALRNKKKPGFQQLYDTVEGFIGQASKYFQGTPPAPGKTSRQNHDELNTAYKSRLNSLVQRYQQRHNGKSPDPATLKIMHGDAMNGAMKDAHSGR